MLLCAALLYMLHALHTPPHPHTHTHSLYGPFPLQGGWQSFGDLFEREHSLIQELRNWVCWISLWRNSCSVYYRYMYACTTGLLSLLWYTLTLLVFVEWMVHVLTTFSLRRNVSSVMTMTMVVYMYVVLEYQSWNYPCMVRSKERLDKTADYLSIYVSSSCADVHLCVQLSAEQQETLLAFRNRWVVVGVFAHRHWRGLGISQQVGVNPFIATLQHCGHGWFNITYVTQSQYIHQ